MLEKLLGNKSAYWVMLYLFHYGEVYPSLIADSLETSLNPIQGQLKKLSLGHKLLSSLWILTLIYYSVI